MTPAEALQNAEEAVASFRRLAAARPDAVEPDLAHSFETLGEVLSGLGRHAAAEAAAAEGIALLTPHAARHPEAHRDLMDDLQATLAATRAGQASGTPEGEG